MPNKPNNQKPQPMGRTRYLGFILIATLTAAISLFLPAILPTRADIPNATERTNVTLNLKNPPSVTHVNEHSIAIEGEITPAIAEKFSAMLGSDVTTLFIFSGGGDPDSSRSIGRIIHARHMTVEVIGACAATCAKYIFVAGAHRILGPESLVLFSDTAASIDLITSSSGDPAIHKVQEREIVADHSFYQEIGIPERLLYDPQDMMHPQCYAALRKVETPNDIAVVNQFGVVILPKSYFDEIGVEVTGAWPSTPEELVRVASKQVKAGKPVGLLWRVNLVPLEQVEDRLRKFGPCSQEQLNTAKAR